MHHRTGTKYEIAVAGLDGINCVWLLQGTQSEN
jgi:hypothetical protein